MTTEDEPITQSDLSCTFCGPGTWATWEIVTDDGVLFTCDRHHAELSEAKIIRLERMRGKKAWEEIPELRETLYEDEYLDDLTGFKDLVDYE
jgi:hypothetical protein